MPIRNLLCLSFLLCGTGVGEHGFHRSTVDAGRRELLGGLARFTFGIDDHFVRATVVKISTELDGCPSSTSEPLVLQVFAEGKPASQPSFLKMTSVCCVGP